MRNLIYISAALLATLSISSCSDWLDYTPKDKFTADQQFATSSGFFDAVNGAYNNMMATSLYGYQLTAGAVDLMSSRYNTGGNSARIEYNFSHFKYTDQSVANAIGNVWSGMYSNILNINVILKYLDAQKGVLTTEEANVIKGEMLALRAFHHFDLLRLFGPVYSKTPEDPSIAFNNSADAQIYPILPANEVVAKLIADLNVAEGLLSASDPVLKEGVLASAADANGSNSLRYRQFRMNYFATVLLKARVYQWAGDNENALAEARKIIGREDIHTIFPFVDSDKLIGNTTDPDRSFSSEVLFGMYNPNLYTLHEKYYDMANLSKATVLRPRTTYLTGIFTSIGDYRLLSQWMTTEDESEFVKFKKITVSESNPKIHYYMQPLMRLSEAYYIAAEALKDTEPVAAVECLNTVLAARAAATLPETATADEIQTELRLEYIREFWGEGQIFFLFKRLYPNIPKALNGEANSAVTLSAATTVWPLPASEQENR
ncbi:MAG: RagB/SusD family nutrient uptake outer membrane protein [Bacteroidales bacterium]|nr:RagB/SusD family nutrient uptake outer membrane protein [Bacteroidales bacterium]